MKKIYSLFALMAISIVAYAQPKISYSKAYGGSDYDGLIIKIKLLSNGDPVILASSSSTNIHAGHHGGTDAYLVRTTSNGDTLWTKFIGGNSTDIGADLIINSNNEIVVLIATRSSNSGDIGQTKGSMDFFFARVDAANGNILASNSFGSSTSDGAIGIAEASKNRYVVVGDVVTSNGDITTPLHGLRDIWAALIDNNGNILKQANYGGSNNEYVNSIKPLSDGNFIFAGLSRSIDHDLKNNNGKDDGWVCKIDTSLNIIWSTTLGGSEQDIIYSTYEHTNGSIFITGTSASIDKDLANVTNTNGSHMVMAAKLSAAGNVQWINCYGGTADEDETGILISKDNKIYISANTASTNGNVTGAIGGNDLWLFAIDTAGKFIRGQCYGGTLFDKGSLDIVMDDTGSIYMAGQSLSKDVDLDTNYGNYDIWGLKLCMHTDTTITRSNNTFTNAHSNPVKSYQWVDCTNNYSPITGANQQTFTATKNGTYALIINNGCRLDTTQCFVANNISTNISHAQINKEFLLYPNPTTGTFSITYKQEHPNIDIEVTNITGKKIGYKLQDNQHDKINVKLQNVPEGVYFIKIKQGGKTHYFRLLKI